MTTGHASQGVVQSNLGLPDSILEMGQMAYGIAFPKGSDELREKVNGALKTLRDNGTYNEIYKKWFGTEPK